MHSFIPPLSPTKVKLLSPSRKADESNSPFEDGVIEIPDSAGLSDETREAIFNVWANDDLDDSGFVEGMHYVKVLPIQEPSNPRTVKQVNTSNEMLNST